MKRLGEHIDAYFYEEQSKNHQCGPDLMTKKPVLDSRLGVLVSRVDLSNRRFNKRRSWGREWMRKQNKPINHHPPPD